MAVGDGNKVALVEAGVEVAVGVTVGVAVLIGAAEAVGAAVAVATGIGTGDALGATDAEGETEGVTNGKVLITGLESTVIFSPLIKILTLAVLVITPSETRTDTLVKPDSNELSNFIGLQLTVEPELAVRIPFVAVQLY